METRLQTTELAIREQANQASSVAGYAVYWNKPAVITDTTGRKFRETFKPNSFTFDEVFGLVNHDIRNILATRSAGLMTVEQDQHGLRFEITLPDTTLGRDTLSNVRAKNYKGASVGFNVVEDRWDFKGQPSVDILKAELKEISLTPIPAHTSTVSVRCVPLVNLSDKKRQLYKILLPR